MKLIFKLIIFINIVIILYNILINIPNLKKKLEEKSDTVKQLVINRNDIINDYELKSDNTCCADIMNESEIKKNISHLTFISNNHDIILNNVKNNKEIGYNFDITDKNLNFNDNIRINNIINNSDTSNNLIVNNDLNISKNIDINNLLINNSLDSQILRLAPQFSIIPWNSEEIPYGWKLCDGKKYILDSDHTITEITTDPVDSIPSSSIIETPDLRNKFLKGFTYNNEDELSGGQEEVTLTVKNLPKHTHEYKKSSRSTLKSGYDADWLGKDYDEDDIGHEKELTGWYPTDDSNRINNIPYIDNPKLSIMPPYYEINFIIKISNKISNHDRIDNPNNITNNFGLN